MSLTSITALSSPLFVVHIIQFMLSLGLHVGLLPGFNSHTLLLPSVPRSCPLNQVLAGIYPDFGQNFFQLHYYPTGWSPPTEVPWPCNKSSGGGRETMAMLAIKWLVGELRCSAPFSSRPSGPLPSCSIASLLALRHSGNGYDVMHKQSQMTVIWKSNISKERRSGEMEKNWDRQREKQGERS